MASARWQGTGVVAKLRMLDRMMAPVVVVVALPRLSTMPDEAEVDWAGSLVVADESTLTLFSVVAGIRLDCTIK
jgi:hypothetical protein